jgi:putative acyl-CoA dehydrogenase
LFGDAQTATIPEGTGNIAALDVLRAVSLQPRSMEVPLGEVGRATDDAAEFLQAASRRAWPDVSAAQGGPPRSVADPGMPG